MRWGGRRKTTALSDKEGGENVSMMVFSFLLHWSSEVRQTLAGGLAGGRASGASAQRSLCPLQQRW